VWKTLGAGLAIVSVAGCTRSPSPAEEGRAALVRTERDFAAASAAYGMKVAFLRYLADDSVLFRPHPVDGKRFTAREPDSSVHLTWEPTDVEVAASGDFGWTTGPFRVEAEADEPAIQGYFVSLWRRQSNGRWKVVVDLGTENPPDDPCPEPPGPVGVPNPPQEARTAIDAPREARTLEELERRFSERARVAGTEVAYEEALRPDARVYRDGSCPAWDRDAARQQIARLPGPMTWEPITASVADSGDLAYTYGSYRVTAPDPTAPPLETGYYVRAWRNGGTEGWRIALDITSPLPAGTGDARPPGP
jgi:ketosteroid isomerase-like protein